MAAPTVGPLGSTLASIVVQSATHANGDFVAPWVVDITTAFLHTMPRWLSNQIRPAASGNLTQARRDGTTYAMPCECILPIITKATTNAHYFDLYLAVDSPDTATYSLYGCEITLSATADTWDLFRVKSGTAAFPITGGSGTASATQELTAGTSYCGLTLEDESGSPRLRCHHWDGASWSVVASYLDSSASKITVAGLYAFEATTGSAWAFGNMYVGTYVPAAAPAEYRLKPERHPKFPIRDPYPIDPTMQFNFKQFVK